MFDASVLADVADAITSEIGEARLRRDLMSGKCAAFHVTINDAASGTLVIEVLPDEIFVWCYQGRDYRTVARALGNLALACGLPRVGWFTFHRAARHVFKRFSPDISNTGIPGEMRFKVDSRSLANG